MNEYKKAGVDVEAGYKSVELIKKHISRTLKPGVLGGIGGFGGMFMPDLSG
ncbi:MAG: phosphoribosylformylglycinamidine cyclo-ligase, partial [Clostridia bacterium]|nr:phosphoribosylformylglycinamidine cyclo-ligase [Clostridia bacterium]